MVDRDDMQRLLLSGNGRLPSACYVLFEIDDPRAYRAWLRTLPVDSAATGRPDDRVVNIAFTYPGLVRLTSDDAFSNFSKEFMQGMVTPHRQRILGDLTGSAHDPAGWRWGGPSTGQVHGMLLLFATGPAELAAASDTLLTASSGLNVLQVLDTHLLEGSREHFGFRDGMTNPRFRELAPDHADTVATGEFVLGYPGERESVPVPSLHLDSHWGRGGSYLVFRQIEQDVPAFWKSIDEKRKTIPGAARDATWLASRMVGRWPEGAPVTEADDPHASGPSAGFPETGSGGREGLACPAAAHVRRSHPRDILDDRGQASFRTRRHRLLRRGRTYGVPCTDPSIPERARTASVAQAPDTAERGLMFICLNSDIGNQFELVQQAWVNNPKFDGGVDSIDPIAGQPMRAGRSTSFVIPERPVHRRIDGWSPAIRVRGGAYFFLPGMAALAGLASEDGGGPRRRA